MLTVTSTLFFCCGASKDYEFQNTPPFKILTSTITGWVGGQPGVRGKKIIITINNPSVQLDTVYFQNRTTLLELEFNSNPPKYVGVIITSSGKNDFLIDKDATKEFGNHLKEIQEKIPFNLKDNEAVVSYHYQHKKHFYKIKNIN